jgi:hypothetical protein
MVDGDAIHVGLIEPFVVVPLVELTLRIIGTRGHNRHVVTLIGPAFSQVMNTVCSSASLRGKILGEEEDI